MLSPGKDYSDFLPGEELSKTLSIFVVPFSRNAAPKDELLEPDLSMHLSKCFRGSEGKLKCITCHDPHRQPAAAEAPAYFRGRCLTCHNEQSCSRPLAERQKLSPPDSCIGCHMPKRDMPAVYHSALTNHRIVKAPQEPFPEAAYQMTRPELPDLVQLSAAPGSHAAPPPLMLLQAYRQIVPAHPEYRERYWSLAKKLETTNGDDIAVLEALADAWSQDKSQNGIEREINYLERARAQGTTQPADFEELGSLLLAGGRWDKAVAALQQGIERVPFDQELYRLLRQAYFLNRDMTNACKVLKDANRLFPQDEGARAFEINHCSVTAH